MQIKTIKEFLKFSIVGGVAFASDAAVLQLMLNTFEISPVLARIPSATVAIIITWLFNRSYTFSNTKNPNAAKSFLAHLSATSIGFSINIGLYTALLIIFEHRNIQPLIALSVASAIGLFINFLLAKHWVFREKPI
jgi:putative flippase GtrA